MNKPITGAVNLPGSKSESNRALMIAAYGGFPCEARNLSEAHDTLLLKMILDQVEHADTTDGVTVDCEDAGTVARFMMTYLAGRPGKWMLTGTERLRQRPMVPLVEALRQLGADITSTPPFVILGQSLVGGSVELDASQSSQFASSLLLAAPTWPQGLRLKLEDDAVSMPYLDMTLALMRHYGVEADVAGSEIIVPPQPYRPRPFTVEADWSAASYWYELMALGEGGSLLLKGLKTNSLQGDEAVSALFAKLGVATEFTDQGVLVSKKFNTIKKFENSLEFDFIDTPDLFPSIFVTCVALNIESVFNNISILYHKESDRINSLITELSKIYNFISIIEDNRIIIKKSSLKVDFCNNKKVVFNTYQDHRIAMALGMLISVFPNASVDAPSVVNKSYPAFWNELKKF